MKRFTEEERAFISEKIKEIKGDMPSMPIGSWGKIARAVNEKFHGSLPVRDRHTLNVLSIRGSFGTKGAVYEEGLPVLREIPELNTCKKSPLETALNHAGKLCSALLELAGIAEKLSSELGFAVDEQNRDRELLRDTAEIRMAAQTFQQKQCLRRAHE
jgi:hypothetical protein